MVTRIHTVSWSSFALLDFVKIIVCVYAILVPSLLWGAGTRISPSEIQQMNSIIKYLDKKIAVDSPDLKPGVRMTALLESCSLLGFNVEDRTRFHPDMSVSEISVVLLGNQLPGMRSVVVSDALRLLQIQGQSISHQSTYKPSDKTVSPLTLLEQSGSGKSAKPIPEPPDDAAVNTNEAAGNVESHRRTNPQLDSENSRFRDLDNIVDKVLSGLPVENQQSQ